MPTPARASLPLVVYAESLCRGARVLLVGNSRSGIARALLERGARLVHVCDGNGPRRAEQQAGEADRAVTYGALSDGPAALREGFFDLALVEDLSAEPDATATLGAIARLLAPRGAALIAAPNPDVAEPLLSSTDSVKRLDYYALYDTVIQALPEVRMLGQVPFVGYALVDFSSESDPSPILDTSLLPASGEEPDYFVALAGREPRSLEEYAVIQLPLGSVGRPGRAATSQPSAATSQPIPATNQPSAPSAELSKQLSRQEAWIRELEARAETADLRADEAEAELDEIKEKLGNVRQSQEAERAGLVGERDALRTENERLRRKINDFDDLLAARKAEIELLTEQGSARQVEVQRLSGETMTQQAELKRLSNQLDLVSAQIAKAHVEIERLSAEAAAKSAELALVSAERESEELDRLEAQLLNRGERILALERDLAQTERLGRELVRKLGELTAPERSRDLSERLAEAEAELVTLRWSLALARTAPLAARAWAPIS